MDKILENLRNELLAIQTENARTEGKLDQLKPKKRQQEKQWQLKSYKNQLRDKKRKEELERAKQMGNEYSEKNKPSKTSSKLELHVDEEQVEKIQPKEEKRTKMIPKNVGYEEKRKELVVLARKMGNEYSRKNAIPKSGKDLNDKNWEIQKYAQATYNNALNAGYKHK